MITINATGDTTLYTAGKYCPEDILVKVPAGGGGSGGGSVETCTVRIVNEVFSQKHRIYNYVFTRFVNGVVTSDMHTIREPVIDSEEYILNDVVCGSGFYIEATGYDYAGYRASDGVEVFSAGLSAMGTAPTTAGSTGILRIYDTD